MSKVKPRMDNADAIAHETQDHKTTTPPEGEKPKKGHRKPQANKHTPPAAAPPAQEPTANPPPAKEEGAAPPAESKSPAESAAESGGTTQIGLSQFVNDVVAGAEHRPGEQALIPIDLIDPSSIMLEVPLNEAKVNSYMGSMSNPRIGQLIDIQVLPKQGGRYELVDGRHRVEAAKRLHATTNNERWKKIRAIIRTDLSPVAATSAAQVMNTARRETTEYEDAVYFKALAAAGTPIEQIALDAGYSPNTVRNRIALLALPPDIVKKIGADWWFGSQHAKVAIPAVETFGKPALHALEEAIKQGDKMFSVGSRMTAEDFRTAFSTQLAQRKLIREVDTAEERTARGRYADLNARFDQLPKITLGEMKTARPYYSNAEEYEKIMQSFRAKEAHAAKEREKAATKKAPPTTPMSAARNAGHASQRHEPKGPTKKELIAERFEEKRREARIAAVNATKDLAPRELALVARDLAGYYEGDEEDNTALREALGLEKSDFDAIFLDLGKKDRDELFLKLARAKDKTKLHRIMIACLVFRDPSSIEHESPLVKFDEQKALAEAEKELEAEAKTTKETKK